MAASVAVALALGGSAFSQEVKVNQYWDASEWIQEIAFGSQRAWVLYKGGDFCFPGANEVMRSADFAGRFPGDEQQVFDCGVDFDMGALAISPSGTILVVTTDEDGDDEGIVGRLFDSDGSPLAGHFFINSITAGQQQWPDVAYLTSDRFAVVWENGGGGPLRARGRIVMPDGSMPFPDVTISPDPTFYARPRVTAAHGGGALVVWHHHLTSQSGEARARLCDEALTPTSPAIVVNEGACRSPFPIPATTDLGYVVVWGVQPVGGGDESVIARTLDVAGVPVGPDIRLNVYSDTQHQSPTDVAFDGRVGVAVWNSDFQDGDFKAVVARRIDAAANPLGDEFVVNGSTFPSQSGGRVGMLTGGDFMVGWISGQDLDNSDSSYLRRYFFPHSLAIAPGRGAANPPTVAVVSPDGLETSATIAAFGTSGYGANVGAGDLDGGLDEALAGPGPSPVFGPQVRAFRPDGTPVAKVSYYAYGTLRYGVRPCGARIDGDAFAEILTAPGEGDVFGPHVRGWNVDGGALAPLPKVSFYAYSTLRWGARASGGDVDGDGNQEILTGPGPGSVFGPVIHGYDYDGSQVSAMGKVSFAAFPDGFYGATVGAADVESDGYGAYGDGFQEILVGRGPDPALPGDFRVFDFDGTSLTQKWADDAFAHRYGISVAGGDVDAGDTEEIVTAAGPDPAAPADILSWEWDPKTGIGNGDKLHEIGPDRFTAFGGQTTHGANVAVGTFE